MLLLTENLSSILGPTTMRGLRKFRIICLLSRWKYWADVVGLTTAMFTQSLSTPSSLLSHIWETKRDELVIIYHSGNVERNTKPTAAAARTHTHTHAVSEETPKRYLSVCWFLKSSKSEKLGLIWEEKTYIYYAFHVLIIDINWFQNTRQLVTINKGSCLLWTKDI